MRASAGVQSDHPLTLERQRREREYYDRFWLASQQFPPAAKVFAPLAGGRRPHNIHWEFLRKVRPMVANRDVLEVGCGSGDFTPLFAQMLPRRLSGFDLSSAAVQIARKRLEHYGLGADLTQMAAESLSYRDQWFDLVVGVSILHHVDIPRAAAELHRVLRPGGQAIFMEWTAWPFFERVRNHPLAVKLFPHGGYDLSRRECTEDERKLDATDRESLLAVFESAEYEQFYLLTRAAPFLPDWCEPHLQRLDHRILRWLPSLSGCSAAAIITLTKSR